MRLLLILVVMIFCETAPHAQTRVILDADIDSDVDDVSALAMLHKMAKQKRITLSGVIVTSDDPYAPECADAINVYFGNRDIPVGFNRNQAELKNHSRYTKQLSNEFPHSLTSYKTAWDAVSLYRKILSSSADKSVVIITIGHLTSLQNLLKSGADSYSYLSGRDLALKKVSKWICMGGMFPSGKEANFNRPDPQSTVYCLQQWTAPVVFCGWEAGIDIISGGRDLQNALSPESPVYRAFELYNNFAGRSSWDQVAVLLLTKQYRKYFAVVRNGYCFVEPDGSNRWITGKKSNHSYIVVKPGVNRNEISALINSMSIK